MADQGGPDIDTSVSPETAVSGASKPPVDPEQEAARTEAAGLKDTEQRGGPGEALQELAESRPGPSILRRTQVAVANSMLDRNGFNPGPSGHIDAETSDYAANKIPVTFNQGGGQQASNADGNEGNGVAPHAGPASLEPELGPSENVRTITEQVKASREAAKARREELGGMSKEQLQDELTELDEGLAGYQAILTGARGLSAEDRDYIFGEMASARAQLAEIRRTISEKQRTTSEQQNFDELRGRVRSSVDAAANMTGFTADQLKDAAGKYKSSAEILQASLDAERQKTNPNADLIRAYELELNDAKARAAESQRLFDEKDSEAKQKRGEEESKHADEAVEEARRKAASIPELNTSIKDFDKHLADLVKKIDKAERTLASATTDDEKETARKTLLDLRREELKAREGKAKDEDALEAAQERKRKESGLKGKFGLDTIRKMSKDEFLALDEEEQTKYLKEVTNVVELPQQQKFERIRDAIERGVSVGIEDRALFAKQVSADLIKNGRNGYDMSKLAEISVQFPDVYNTIIDRWSQHEASQKALKENFPSDWDKVLKFAKDHPSWFIALLLMLAAPAVAAVGVPAVAMASGKVLSKGLL